MPREDSECVNTPKEIVLKNSKTEEQLVTVTRTDGEICTHVSFPTASFAVFGDGPVNLTLNYNLTVDAREQYLHDERVIKNTELHSTPAIGDSVVTTLANALSKLFG
jgi:hypothetical protein